MTTTKGSDRARQNGKSKKMTMGAAIAGAAAGAIVGAAAGAALADKKNREKIGEKLNEFKDGAQEAWENAQEK